MNTNNQTAFTPGPWEVTRLATSMGNRCIETKHQQIARTVNAGASMKESIEEEEANAHLIAAAPEMYKALKNVWERVEFKNYPDEMRQLVENALAKANGQ